MHAASEDPVFPGKTLTIFPISMDGSGAVVLVSVPVYGDRS